MGKSLEVALFFSKNYVLLIPCYLSTHYKGYVSLMTNAQVLSLSKWFMVTLHFRVLCVFNAFYLHTFLPL